MTWRIVAFTLIAACPSSLYAVIFVPREYHGKTQFCMTKSATEVGDVEKRVQLVLDEVFVGDASAVTAIGNQACLGTEIQVGQNWLVCLFRDSGAMNWCLIGSGANRFSKRKKMFRYYNISRRCLIPALLLAALD
jgi:hypothetical protein